MAFLLHISRLIDRANEKVGCAVYWLVLAAVLISSLNAVVRYVFNVSSNAWLELQWYLFSAVFLLCAGYAHLHNEHIRIDIVVGEFSPRTRAWIDILGGLFFLLPMAVLIFLLSLPFVMDSVVRQEMSSDAGGLIRWPVKLLLPIGFALLILQGISEIVKRIGFLAGRCSDPGANLRSSGNIPDGHATKPKALTLG